jgi:flagellar assembly protein FliH
MSDRRRSAALAALGGGSGGFARDDRFAALRRVGAGDGRPDIVADPVADAYARGLADGAETAAATAQAAAAADFTARHRIETALAAMEADAIDALAQRLQATVLALCGSMLAEAAIAPDALARRAAAAAARFARSGEERGIRLHPEDLALVHGRLPESWHCEPDPALERGALRVETADGGVEDGPAQWQAALAEALRT